MSSRWKFIIGLLLIISLSGFSSSWAEDYLIGRGDRLNISVWGNKNLNADVTVRPDGMITFPLIGEVKAEGLKPLQLRKILVHKLVEFVKNPEVTVNVLGMENFKIYVFGSLSAAGVHSIQGATTMLQFFSTIGKIPDNIDLAESFLIRNNKRHPLDLEQLLTKGDLSQNIIIKPGDTLFFKSRIPEESASSASTYSNMIRVLGEVKKPGMIKYNPGMTILDVILAAGSFTDYAAPGGTKIVRKTEDNKILEIEIDMTDVMAGAIDKNVEVNPGDVISVPASFF
ncbi:MAG: polysaccharide biosynthesis/export family protein [bacterium]